MSTAPGRLLSTPPLPPRLIEGTWETLGWRPHTLQRSVLLDRSRQIVVSAGRRAGKSQMGGYKLIPEVFRALGERGKLEELNQRREYWIVGPEYSDSEKEFRVLWDGLVKLGFKSYFEKPGSYNNPTAGEMRIQMFGGKLIFHAKSAKYPGTLVGEGLSGVVFSEAAKLKPSVYNKSLRPTLADFGGWAFFGSTPEGRNWFYDFYDNGQNLDRQDWSSYRAPSWVNPHVYPVGVDAKLLERIGKARELGQGRFRAFLQSIERVQTEMGLVPVGIDPEIWSLWQDMSREKFAQEIAAEFTEYVGRVFKDWDESIHLREQELRPDWKTYACADYGFTNPFVWLLLQVDPHGERIHIVDEYYEYQKTTGEAKVEIRERGLAPQGGGVRVLEFFPDPSEPDRTREMANYLGISPASDGALPKKDRIEWIRRKLKTGPTHLEPWDPERKPWLTANRRCVHFRREMDAYRYPETAEEAAEKGRSAPEEPLKKDDHTPEALGRFMGGFFGSPWRESRPASQQGSAVGRRGRTAVRR